MSPGMIVGASLLGVSALALAFVRRQHRRRLPKGMAWSDDSPKPPFTHNLER